MSTAKPTSAEVIEIQRRMAQVRHELHEEVREAVKGAQSLTDWRSQVRNHPWLALGAAAALGYLLVPKRRVEPAPTIVAVSPHPTTVPTAATRPEEPKRRKRWGLIGSALGLLGPVAVRAAQNYAIQYLEQWLAAQPPGGGASILGAGMMPGARPPAHGTGRTGGPGSRPGPSPTVGPNPNPYSNENPNRPRETR
jgi:hypothetical protein